MGKTKRHKCTHVGVGSAELEAFLLSLRRRNCTSSTLVTRRGGIKDFLRFLAPHRAGRLQDVEERDLEAYHQHLAERDLKSSTMDIYLRSVRIFFNWLEQTQRIFTNPAARIVLPKPRRKLQPVPTESQMQRVLAQPDLTHPRGVRDRAMLEVAYSTGARRAELIGMNETDPDLEHGLIRVAGKGRKQRVLPLGKQALHWLRRYTEKARPELIKRNPDEPALWVGRQGRRIHPHMFDNTIIAYGKQAGLEIRLTPHAVRRACATHMLAGGAHPVQLQMLLGHANLRSLSQYLKVTITDLKKAHAKTNPGR